MHPDSKSRPKIEPGYRLRLLTIPMQEAKKQYSWERLTTLHVFVWLFLQDPYQDKRSCPAAWRTQAACRSWAPSQWTHRRTCAWVSKRPGQHTDSHRQQCCDACGGGWRGLQRWRPSEQSGRCGRCRGSCAGSSESTPSACTLWRHQPGPAQTFTLQMHRKLRFQTLDLSHIVQGNPPPFNVFKYRHMWYK